MKSLFSYLLQFFFIFILLSFKVYASENESALNNSHIIIADKYAERFCNAKADNFFEGLENEKILKYSYFKYIGLQSEEIFSMDMYQPLINQIKEKCRINNQEKRELEEFFLKGSAFRD